MKRHFWKDFATGATFGAAGVFGVWALGRVRQGEGRVVRIEKSLQIGRPVEEVFGAWADLGKMPEYYSAIDHVRRTGDRSHWVATVDGKRFEWDAELEQIIANQAIGWKSIRGPKHTGRISFSPIGRDTLLHVQMNYVPRLHFPRPALAPIRERLGAEIDRALRGFKAAMESGAVESAEKKSTTMPAGGDVAGRATGTYGVEQSEPPG